jgi:hypothetical protein
MSHADAFNRPPTTPLLASADDVEARMLQRFHRWADFAAAVRDAARRDDSSARLDALLRRAVR